MDLTYRIWNTNENKWEKENISILEDGTIFNYEKKEKLSSEIYIVNRGTGFFDINENPIFEKDIIKVMDQNLEMHDNDTDEGIGIVEYLEKDLLFYVDINVHNGLADLYNYDEKVFEIIGNIYHYNLFEKYVNIKLTQKNIKEEIQS